ncbi:LRR receptor-like serine/threonine-protein kinase fls2 [Datura stramonium]|uniref:LRR receptor-like serine/threonine-protein kinase fls2 n=1 Tax=Datura stramonium TaxID=4076 RepID=A0ABS8S8I4_DATST|nr:LRR receptor-like serine/threonine-protein kinase fls2 [Datura stramonium]
MGQKGTAESKGKKEDGKACVVVISVLASVQPPLLCYVPPACFDYRRWPDFFEVAALKAFKNSVSDDPSGALVDWTDANHHCNWSGIICDPSSNHVINISLIGTQPKAQYLRFSRKPSKLQVLDLTLNSFTGNIPAQLGYCTDLAELIFYQNSLSGEIPAELET